MAYPRSPTIHDIRVHLQELSATTLIVLSWDLLTCIKTCSQHQSLGFFSRESSLAPLGILLLLHAESPLSDDLDLIVVTRSESQVLQPAFMDRKRWRMSTRRRARRAGPATSHNLDANEVPIRPVAVPRKQCSTFSGYLSGPPATNLSKRSGVLLAAQGPGWMHSSILATSLWRRRALTAPRASVSAKFISWFVASLQRRIASTEVFRVFSISCVACMRLATFKKFCCTPRLTPPERVSTIVTTSPSPKE